MPVFDKTTEERPVTLGESSARRRPREFSMADLNINVRDDINGTPHLMIAVPLVPAFLAASGEKNGNKWGILQRFSTGWCKESPANAKGAIPCNVDGEQWGVTVLVQKWQDR